MSLPCILACGAWLKNTACLLRHDDVRWSVPHGDLSTAQACVALEQSVTELLSVADGCIDAVAHDLHPDFYSTQLAVRVAQRLGVPAIGVQHHHAHIGVALAERGMAGPVIGLALDGLGVGTDGGAWGGELLWVHGTQWRRLGHLSALALPGGDAAAREPWRMAAAALFSMGRAVEIVPRFGPNVGEPAARMVHTLLQRGLNAPLTTSAGRWFDAAAGALGLCVKQTHEAEAAIALEQLATSWLSSRTAPDTGRYVSVAGEVIDLRPLLSRLFELGARVQTEAAAEGAALFHLVLADSLALAASRAAAQADTRAIVLGGGCFFNKVLTQRLKAALEQQRLHVLMPTGVDCGDAGLALGQAWVAAHTHRTSHPQATAPRKELLPCA